MMLWDVTIRLWRWTVGIGWRDSRWPYHWTLPICWKQRYIGRVYVWRRFGVWYERRSLLIVLLLSCALAACSTSFHVPKVSEMPDRSIGSVDYGPKESVK